MKKKLLLFLVIVAAVACLFTLSASAESVHEGKVDLNATVTLNDTNNTVLKLFDNEGNALIWYIDANSETGYSSIRADANTIGGPYVDYQVNSWAGSTHGVYDNQVDTIVITDASGNTISNSNIVVFNIMDDDVKVTSSTNNSYKGLVGNPVNSICSVFKSNTNIQYAYLRLDTNSVQGETFYGATNLVYVNLSELTQLQRINKYAFRDCTNLFSGQTLDLSNTILIDLVGDGIFAKVPMTGVKFPSTLTSLGNSWCFQETGLTSVTIPSGVTKIPGSTFKKCVSLTDVTLHSAITLIDDYAFQDCKLLETVNFEDATSLKTIGTGAFERCYAIGRVDLKPTALVTLENCAFADSAMTYVSLPSTLKDLADGNSHFRGNKLTEVVGLEDTQITEISHSMFRGQSNWKPEKIVLPNTVTKICTYGLADVKMYNISLGAGVTQLDHEAFTGCSNLQNVYMPGVATLNNSPFNGKGVRFFVTSEDSTIISAIATNVGVAETNIITYQTYSANPDNYKSGKYVISGYNTCDAFYNSVHKKPDGTDKACETDFVCTICKDNIAGHTPVITIEYKNGFAVVGVKTVTCSCDNAGTYDADPIFVTKGYSIKENNGYGIISTYVINDVALKEYEDLNGPITFGIIMANANFDGESAFMSKNDQDKYVLNSSYGVQLEITNRNYAKINATIDKFTQDEASLNLVMALYVIEDDNVTYIQHEGTYAGEITKDATLDIVTITKIAEINDIQITLPEPALVPAGNDEE